MKENRLPLRLLKWFCPDHLYEEIEGDLIQKFHRDVQAYGERKAKRKLLWNVIRFFRPGIILRNKFSVELNQWDMLRYHLKFSIRIFLRNKFFSTLNILGLSLGIAVGIILLLILQNDLTYDQHYANQKRIYRLGSHYKITGVDEYIGITARELGPVLKEGFPEIEAMTRIIRMDRQLVRKEDDEEEKAFYEDRLIQADDAYFQLFDHEFIYGDVNTCLNNRHSVVITQSMAKKYFNDPDPLGKTLVINHVPRGITGVIRDIPENTHLKFDFLLSGLDEIRENWTSTIENGKPISLLFWNPDVYTYLLLQDNYNVQDFYDKFSAVYDTYFKEAGDEASGENIPILEQLADIHFYSHLQDGEQEGNLNYLYALAGIGFFIIVLACINYMNLSTAKAANRAAEIGVRKITGSSKRGLLLSTLSESLLLSLVSCILAILLVAVLLEGSSFNQLINKNLTLDFLNNPLLLFGSLFMTLCIGLLSGLYPAFYLTNIPAVKALKGVYKNSKSGQLFRNVLMTVQFSVSMFVVACTFFMRDQIHFIMNKDLGFNKDNVLVIPLRDTLMIRQLPIIKNELFSNPNIEAVTASENVMGLGIGSNIMYGESPDGMQQYGGILGMSVGDDYLKSMGLKLINGRDFQPGPDADMEGVYIANESAVKLMGWGNDPLGKKVTLWEGENPGEVIGVVKDFNVNALYQGVDPMFIIKGHWDAGFLQIRLAGHDLPGTIAYVKDKWSGYDSRPFEYFFLDQKFNEQYRADINQNKLLSLLMYICIFISLLGLVGLSAFTATQRTKEIGIRKVLGANIPDIIHLLSKTTLLLVMLSAVIVAPFSYWAINRWLDNFAYRTELNYTLYLIITLAALGFVFLTILFQSLKTARANPVDSLKYE
ncbi:MAG: ABC transporter permease [Cyclobacteriaceae bacterium]|nr:ABC transporter permease [Cyclobacteriaceae bacterium]